MATQVNIPPENDPFRAGWFPTKQTVGYGVQNDFQTLLAKNVATSWDKLVLNDVTTSTDAFLD